MQQQEKPTIKLETEAQLRIYMLPLRQKILHLLRVLGRPETSKHVADALGISPSSARHHLLKLQEIGVVEHDHYQMINGIRAQYLRAADVHVSIGTNMDDGLSAQREALAASVLADIVARFNASLPALRMRSAELPGRFSGDMLGGIAHLSDADAEQFYRMTRAFLDEHGTAHTDSERPWEYAIVLYEVL